MEGKSRESIHGRKAFSLENSLVNARSSNKASVMKLSEQGTEARGMGRGQIMQDFKAKFT